MPTYEYRCPEGHEFERFFRKISDAMSELLCPECGKIAARQMSAGAGLLFKGSGFYLTDYGKNAHRKGGEAKSDKSGASESSGGETKSSESKSESKTESKSESKPAESKPAESKADKPASKSTKAGE